MTVEKITDKILHEEYYNNNCNSFDTILTIAFYGRGEKKARFIFIYGEERIK